MSATMAIEKSWDEEWQQALDRLESDLTAAERLAARPETALEHMEAATAWTPPAIPAPLPVSLHGRAHELVARQKAVMDVLSTKAQALRRQEALLSGGTFDKPGPRPAYLDISA